MAVRAQVAQEVAQHLLGGKAGSLAPRRAGRGGGVGNDAVDQTLKLIKDQPGLRTEKMYEQLSMPRQTIKAALHKLREQDKVKVKGERRAATYWPA